MAHPVRLRRLQLCLAAVFLFALFVLVSRPAAASGSRLSAGAEVRALPAARLQTLLDRLQHDRHERQRVLEAYMSGRISQLDPDYAFFTINPTYRRLLRHILLGKTSPQRPAGRALQTGRATMLSRAAGASIEIEASYPEGAPHALAFYKDFLIAGIGAAVAVYDVSSGQPARTLTMDFPFEIVDLLAEGGRLYVFGEEEMQIFDLSALGKRGSWSQGLPLLGQLAFSFALETARIIQNTLFAVYFGGVAAFDITNPATIFQLFTLKSPYTLNAFVEFPYIYVATWNGFRIFDISDPSNPQMLSEYTTTETIRAYYYLNNFMYLAFSSYILGVDVSDRANPKEKTTIPVMGTRDISSYTCGNGSATLVTSTGFVVNGYNPASPSTPLWSVFVNYAVDRLIFGKTVCENPRHAGGFGLYGFSFFEVAANGVSLLPWLQNTVWPNLISIFRPVSDGPPVNPYELYGAGLYKVFYFNWTSDRRFPEFGASTLSGLGDEYGFTPGGAVTERNGKRTLYLGLNSNGGLAARDVTDFFADQQNQVLPIKEFINQVIACGNFLYVAAGEGKLYVLEVLPDGSMKQRAVLDYFPDEIHKIVVPFCGDRMYVAAGDAGLIILDISNPASPSELGRYTSHYVGKTLTVDATHAYFWEMRSSTIYSVDISIPSLPSLTSSLDLTDSEYPNVSSLQIKDDYLHIHTLRGMHQVYQVNNGQIGGFVSGKKMLPASSMTVESGGAKKASGGPIYFIYTSNWENGAFMYRFVPETANAAPAFLQALADTAVKQGETLEFQYRASDADGDSLWFLGFSLPSGASLDSRSGLFHWAVPSDFPVGAHGVEVGVTDGIDTTRTRATVTVVTATAVASGPIPDRFRLESVFPNPFVDRLFLQYDASQDVVLRLALFDVLGRQVVAEREARGHAGTHQLLEMVTPPLAPGVYFLKITAGDGLSRVQLTTRVVRLK